MPGFLTHLLSGVIIAALVRADPASSLAIIVGAVFPDIDAKNSIPHKTLLLLAGVGAVAWFRRASLMVALSAGIAAALLIEVWTPKHRGWLHGLRGQLLFSTLCYLLTLNPASAVGGLIGTTLHRILDMR